MILAMILYSYCICSYHQYVCVSDAILLFQWSYGVTCWEIFSLGRIPYPGADNANIITLLKCGKRLEQPELCPSEM